MIAPNHVRNAILKKIADAPGSERLSLIDREYLYADMLAVFNERVEVPDLMPVLAIEFAAEPEYPETD